MVITSSNKVALFLLFLLITGNLVAGEKKMNKTGVKYNKLADSTSPYLLEHATNPVNWYPWGEEALQKAKQEDKPVFLSIGYSACHWCHVMAKESFSNPQTAAILNKYFISIKVDREERPDLDDIYMNAVQIMTGRGGWPLSVFLTPDLKPFYGGTYFPPQSRYGMPGFPELLQSIAQTFKNERKRIEEGSKSVTASLQKLTAITGQSANEGFKQASIFALRQHLLSSLDSKYGGFGQAPKFPSPGNLFFLLEEYQRQPDDRVKNALEITLQKMADGGFRDQLGGGFHRYSTDRYWRIPHFEKMLYDNGLLSQIYLNAYQLFHKKQYAETAKSTLDFIIREMQAPAGGFYATLNADSENEEGTFYVWTEKELVQLLGTDQARRLAKIYGVNKSGNFTRGKNVLHFTQNSEELAKEENLTTTALAAELRTSKAKLLTARNQRIRPDTDRKIITAWNGMAIKAFAQASMILAESRFLEAGKKSADFILQNHFTNQQLIHSSIENNKGTLAFLDDYAYFADSLLDLYMATQEEKYFFAAIKLGKQMRTIFADFKGNGLYYSKKSKDKDFSLPSRSRKLLDNATPSPNAVAWHLLQRLERFTNKGEFTKAINEEQNALANALQVFKSGSAYALAAFCQSQRRLWQIEIIGYPDNLSKELLQTARQEMPQGSTLIFLNLDSKQAKELQNATNLLQNKTRLNHKTTAWLCLGQTCFKPVTSTNDLENLINHQ